MELVFCALGAFVVEALLIVLLIAPRWTLRTLGRPFRAVARRRDGAAVSHTRPPSAASAAPHRS